VKRKKHNKYLGPRCKRMKRPARLQSAKNWLPKYEGKSLIRGYSRHFGVSCLCAALELRMLGYDISDERIEQYKKEEEAKHRKALLAKQKRMEQELENYPVESNEWFSYIAGYTAGRAAYGVEWEDLWEGYEYLKSTNTDKEENEEEDFGLPF
jgi:hypothetical protein